MIFLGPKIFSDQIFPVPKFFRTQYFFGPKIFLDPKIFSDPNFFDQIFFGPKTFLEPQNIFQTRNFFLDPKLFCTLNYFGPKIILDPNYFCTQNFKLVLKVDINQAWIRLSLQSNCLGLDWAPAQPSLFQVVETDADLEWRI